MDKIEIDSLMDISSGRRLEILIILKELNREAHLFMRRFGKRYKQSYHELWKTSYWKEAKILLKEYFTIEGNGILRCKKCNNELTDNYTLHHSVYNDLNLFTPIFIEPLCSNGTCHERSYSKRNIKKRKK